MISDETTLGFSPQWGHEVRDHVRCDSWLQLASEPFVSIHLQMNMPGSYNSRVASKPRHYGRQGVRFGQHRGSAWVWANQLKACASYRRSGSVAFFIERKDSIVELFSAMMVCGCAKIKFIAHRSGRSSSPLMIFCQWLDEATEFNRCPFVYQLICATVSRKNPRRPQGLTETWVGGGLASTLALLLTLVGVVVVRNCFCGWLFSHGLLAVALILCSWEWLYAFLSSFFMTCALNTVITSWY